LWTGSGPRRGQNPASHQSLPRRDDASIARLDDVDPAFDSAINQRVDALIVGTDPGLALPETFLLRADEVIE